MKRLLLAASSLLFLNAASADVTISYPNEKAPLFTISVAKDFWEYSPNTDPKVDDGYSVLTAGDTVIFFRAVKATKDGLPDAIKDTVSYVKKEYPGVKIPEAAEAKVNGYEARTSSAKGKDKDGDSCDFGFAWIFVDDSHLAEIWYEASKEDVEGYQGAKKLVDSFKVAKKKEKE